MEVGPGPPEVGPGGRWGLGEGGAWTSGGGAWVGGGAWASGGGHLGETHLREGKQRVWTEEYWGIYGKKSRTRRVRLKERELACGEI